MNLIFLSIMGGVAALSFSAFFNGERETWLTVFIGGFIAWFVYSIMIDLKYSEIASSFTASLFVGLSGEVFSRIMKKPVTIFLIPSIIPLVPGLKIYYMMYYLVLNESMKAYEFGRDTFLIAGAISLGVLFASVFSKSILGVRRRRVIHHKKSY